MKVLIDVNVILDVLLAREPWAAAAAKIGADYVATRNAKDFKRSPVKARSPSELLALLA